MLLPLLRSSANNRTMVCLTMTPFSLTQLLFRFLKRLFEVRANVRRVELEDEAALSGNCGEFQLGGQEGHTEGQRLLLRQLPVHRGHQVLYHLVQRLRKKRREGFTTGRKSSVK